MFKVPQVCN